jgi:Ca-activated chloride channel family protein
LLDETAIGMAGPRTAFGDAIGLGVTLFEHSDAPAKTVIALTDGNDTASQVPPVEVARHDAVACVGKRPRRSRHRQAGGA